MRSLQYTRGRVSRGAAVAARPPARRREREREREPPRVSRGALCEGLPVQLSPQAALSTRLGWHCGDGGGGGAVDGAGGVGGTSATEATAAAGGGRGVAGAVGGGAGRWEGEREEGWGEDGGLEWGPDSAAGEGGRGLGKGNIRRQDACCGRSRPRPGPSGCRQCSRRYVAVPAARATPGRRWELR